MEQHRIKELKIRLKILTVESRLNKTEDNKLRKYADFLHQRAVKKHGKNVAAPVPRPFKEVEDRAEKQLMVRRQRAALGFRRKTELRNAARSGFLAYALLRGKPYAQVEVGSYNLPNFRDIEWIAEEYSVHGDNSTKERYAKWYDEAVAYWGEKGNLNDPAIYETHFPAKLVAA